MATAITSEHPLASIHSLSPELLTLIFRLGTENYDDLYSRDQNAFLMAASLTNSFWRHQAQELLWRRIRLVSERKAQRILRSPLLGRHQTWRLVLFGAHAEDRVFGNPKALKENTAIAVMKGLRGIRDLELGGLGAAGLQMLSSPELSQVRCLFVWQTRKLLPSSLPNSTPAFQLQTLLVRQYTNDFKLPYDLLRSSCTSLRSFGVSGDIIVAPQEDFLSFLTFIAPTLQSLNLSFHHPNYLLLLLPAFERLQNLQNLSVRCDGPDLFTAIQILPESSKLACLKVTPSNVWNHKMELFLGGIRDVLTQASLAGLKRLEFGCESGYYHSTETWKKLGPHLARQGVVVASTGNR